MPIFEQTYRAYEGELRPRFRWWAIVVQEWRVVRKSVLLWLLVVPAGLHFLFRALYIFLIDLVASMENHPLAEMTQGLPVTTVEPTMFLSFIRIQSPLVFLLFIFAGSGLICNDFRYNLIEMYFSRPLSWIDYLLGKTMTLVIGGLILTAVPALALLGMHFVFSPKLETLEKLYWVPFPIVFFSLVVVVPAALAVLASSSLFNSQRFAGIAVFMIASVNSVFGGILPEVLREEKLRLISYPVSVNRIGEALFRQPNLVVDAPWQTAFLFVGAVTALALAIVCARIRRAGGRAR